MWHYHLEYAEKLRELAKTFSVEANGPGATSWTDVDRIVNSQWRDDSSLNWLKMWSGNQWILFLAPLFLSAIHMVMLGWVLWSMFEYGPYIAIGIGTLLSIGFACVWFVSKPVLEKVYGTSLTN